MPLQNDISSDNKLNDKIDFDFYDSTFEVDVTNDEETCGGVKKVQIKPIVDKSSNSDLTVESDVDAVSKEMFINNSDCDLNDSVTKCIAYETSPNEIEETFEDSCASGFSGEVSPILRSSLSETPTSDLTTVTPLTSSSSYSSLKEKLDEDTCSVTEDSSKGNMNLLAEAVETLSLQNKTKRRSGIPVSTSSKQLSKPRRKNMTFTNDQLRKIDRENEILLKKIMSYSKPRSKPSVTLNNTTQPRTIKASAAVNRSKKQRDINHDNYILLKKIHNAKPTQSYYNSRSQL